MASLCKPSPISHLNAHSLFSPRQYLGNLSFPFCITASSRPLCALKTGSDGSSSSSSSRLERQEVYDARKPVVSPLKDFANFMEERQESQRNGNYEDRWVDWEDKILEDTVPLAGFVRMVLHSGKYESGDRLSPEHERTILERLLPFHPEFEKKIGCGIDYITVGYHPDFERSRCLFILQKDGKLVDFSYWKCIKGLIRKNYPLYADSFILRHFRNRRRRY